MFSVVRITRHVSAQLIRLQIVGEAHRLLHKMYTRAHFRSRPNDRLSMPYDERARMNRTLWQFVCAMRGWRVSYCSSDVSFHLLFHPIESILCEWWSISRCFYVCACAQRRSRSAKLASISFVWRVSPSQGARTAPFGKRYLLASFSRIVKQKKKTFARRE